MKILEQDWLTVQLSLEAQCQWGQTKLEPRHSYPNFCTHQPETNISVRVTASPQYDQRAMV